MAKKKVAKVEKLLNEMKKRGSMTHKDAVKFLLRGTGRAYSDETRRLYDSTLYGTLSRVGVFERWCVQNKDGSYRVRAKANITSPFTVSADLYQ